MVETKNKVKLSYPGKSRLLRKLCRDLDPFDLHRLTSFEYANPAWLFSLIPFEYVEEEAPLTSGSELEEKKSCW